MTRIMSRPTAEELKSSVITLTHLLKGIMMTVSEAQEYEKQEPGCTANSIILADGFTITCSTEPPKDRPSVEERRDE